MPIKSLCLFFYGFLSFFLIDLVIPLYMLDKNSLFMSSSIRKNELGHEFRAWTPKPGCLDSNLDVSLTSSVILAKFITSVYLCYLVWKMERIIIVPVSHHCRIQWIRTQYRTPKKKNRLNHSLLLLLAANIFLPAAHFQLCNEHIQHFWIKCIHPFRASAFHVFSEGGLPCPKVINKFCLF